MLTALIGSLRRYSDIVLFASAAVFFVLTTPTNRTEAGDAFVYAFRAEKPEFEVPTELAHLAFMPLMQGIYKIAQVFGYSGRAYNLLLGVGVVSAAATVVFAYRILRDRLGLEPPRSLVGAALIAVSYIFLAYAAEVEVYGLAIAISSGLVLVVTADRLTWPRTAAIVFLGGLVVLTHAMLVLVTYVVVPVTFVLRGKVRMMYAYLVGVSAMLMLVTYGIFRLASSGPTGVAEYMAFLLNFPRRGTALGFGWIIEAAAYFVLTFIGYNFLFAFPAFQRLAEKLFGRFSLEEEKYLGDNTPQVLAVAGCLTAAFLGVIILIFFYKGLRSRPARLRSVPASAVVTWFVTTAAVQLWAGGVETWQFITVPFWVAVVWTTRMVSVGWPALLAVSLGIHNLVGGLGPLYSPKADLFANKSAWIIDQTGPTDLVGTAGSVVFFRYLRYWAPAEVLHLQFLTKEELFSLSSDWEEKSRDVYLTADVLEPPALRSLTPTSDSEYRETYDALVDFGRIVSGKLERVFTDEFGGVFRFDKT